MAKQRVLHVIPSCRVGGVPRLEILLLRELIHGGIEVEVAAPDDGPFYQLFEQIAVCHDLQIRGFYPSSLLALRKLIRDRKIDIVHAMGRGAGLYSRLASLGLRVEIVYAYHGFSWRHLSAPFGVTYRIAERLMEKFTSVIVCVSESERGSAIDSGAASGANIVVIPNGIDITRFSSSRARSSATRGDSPHIGTLSRTCAQKGLEFLIESVALLKKRYPAIRCSIAGGAQVEELPRQRSLERLVRNLNVEENVQFLDEVRDVPAFFCELDAYVSSSLWEGLPTAVLEAFAARVPVVATDVVGNRDLVKNGITGILVKPANALSLAEGVSSVLENARLAEMCVVRAANLVGESYTSKVMGERYATLYQSLLTREA